LSFEQKARLHERKRRRDEKLADEELKTNIMEQERFELPTAEELEKERQQVPDLTVIHQRIHEVARVLANFAQLRDPNR
jgi:ribosomal RNA methyltransferase Nop2